MRAIFLISVAILLSGCPQVDGADVSAARDFYRQPSSVQQSKFRQYSLEEQLLLFFYGNQVRHPPAIYLARCFALNGDAAIKLLHSRLKSESDDLTVRDIATLLATADAMGQYDVASDMELMDALKGKTAQMRDVLWRDTAEQQVASIGHRRGKSRAQAPECGEAM